MPSTFMKEKELNMLKVLRVGEKIKKSPHSYYSNQNCYLLTSLLHFLTAEPLAFLCSLPKLNFV